MISFANSINLMTNSVEFDEALTNQSQLVSNIGAYFDKGSICLLMVRLAEFADSALAIRDSRKEFKTLCLRIPLLLLG